MALNCSVVTNFTDNLATIKLYRGNADGLLKFATAYCSILTCIGVTGNLIGIVAMAKYYKVRSATTVFLINLSVADLLICFFTLPPSVLTFSRRSWILGNIMCKIISFARVSLNLASKFTICAIAINRYIMIAHPKLYRKMYTSRNIIIMLTSIWMASLGPVIATFFGKWWRLGLDTEYGYCNILPNCSNIDPQIILYFFVLLLTLTTVISCYARMYFIVRRVTRTSIKIRKRVPRGKPVADTLNSVTINASESSNDTGPDPEANDTTIISKNLQVTIKIDSDYEKERVNEKIKSFQHQLSFFRKPITCWRLSLPTRKDKRLGAMILVIMFSFLLCHLPITLSRVFSYHGNMHVIAHVLYLSFPCVNPFIYVVMPIEYRKAFKNLFKDVWSQSQKIRLPLGK